MIDRFAYISCDRSDLERIQSQRKLLIDGPIAQKLSPSMVRGLAIGHRDAMRELIRGSKVVLVVAGLGGATGSGLAPIVAELAKECGSIPVSVAIMPFGFEKKLRFYAGLALRRLRASSSGVIVVDNDDLLRASGEDATLKEIHDLANFEVVGALSCLLSKPSENAIPAGLNKVLGTVLQDGYSILSTARSGSVDKTEEAIARAVIGINAMAEGKEARHAVVALSGDSTLSASETGMAVKRLGSIMGNEAMDLEYSVRYTGQSQLLVGVLASGFKSTKYDEYDPLGSIFGKNDVIDDGMDYALIPGLESLQSCE
jgi:cell division protein FtsZ